MFPDLASPKQPIAIRTEHVVTKNTTFRFQQHGKGWSSGKFTLFRPVDTDATAAPSEKNKQVAKAAPPEVLMSIDGDYMSRDSKRSFKDASGLPLFDIHHGKFGVKWSVVLPGDKSSETPIARIHPRFSGLKDNLELEVKNAAANGEEVTLRVQGQDIWKQRTNVYLGDKIVMTMKRTEKMAVYLPGKKMEWTVDLAAGMDVSVAAAILVVMAANMYGSNYTYI